MQDFGETIKRLRLSRSISQEELAAGLFDRSTLSKIENGTVHPSRENTNIMIARLSLVEEEFDYIRNNYKATEKEQIFYQLFDIGSSIDTNKIDSLIEKCQVLKNDADIKRITKILRAQLLFNQPEGLSRAKELVRPIWYDYLSKIKVLTITDIYLLNMIAYAFDYETNIQIITKILNTIDKYYPFLKFLKCSTLINLASLQIDHLDYARAKETLLKAAKLAKEVGQYDKLLLCRAEIALCDNDQQQAESYAELLDKIGATHFVQPLRAEIAYLEQQRED